MVNNRISMITSNGFPSLGARPFSSHRLILAFVVFPGSGMIIGLDDLPPSVFTLDGLFKSNRHFAISSTPGKVFPA